MNKICVYAICKNESQFVERWVKSMSEADSIVVLDTGSSDDTVLKLRKLGVKVEQKLITPWRFDVARNESLKLVPEDCNIMVCTDLDEVFEPGWANVLRENWDSKKHRMCWYKYAWSHTQDGKDENVFWYNKIHCRGFKWVFPVHEGITISEEYEELLQGLQDLTIENGIKLHHYPAKKDRSNYLPLLELRKEENPGDGCSNIYLAREYFFYSRYKDCIDCLTKYIDEREKYATQPIELAYSALLIGKSYENMSDDKNAVKAFKMGIELDEAYRENYIALAKILMKDNNDLDGAYDVLKKALEKSYRRYSWLEDGDIYTEVLYDMLSISAYYTGRKKESLLYSFLAREINPYDERLVNNVKLIMDNITDKELI